MTCVICELFPFHYFLSQLVSTPSIKILFRYFYKIHNLKRATRLCVMHKNHNSGLLTCKLLLFPFYYFVIHKSCPFYNSNTFSDILMKNTILQCVMQMNHNLGLHISSVISVSLFSFTYCFHSITQNPSQIF